MCEMLGGGLLSTYVVMIVFVVFRYLYEVSINYPEFVQDLESVICFWRFL